MKNKTKIRQTYAGEYNYHLAMLPKAERRRALRYPGDFKLWYKWRTTNALHKMQAAEK